MKIARPYFDPYDEVDDPDPSATAHDFQKKVKFILQEVKAGAAGTAIVSGLGTISSVAISTGGIGYSTAVVSFGSTSIDVIKKLVWLQHPLEHLELL